MEVTQKNRSFDADAFDLQKDKALYNEYSHGEEKTIYMGGEDSYPYVFDSEAERKLISEFERTLNGKNEAKDVNIHNVSKDANPDEEDHSEYDALFLVEGEVV